MKRIGLRKKEKLQERKAMPLRRGLAFLLTVVLAAAPLGGCSLLMNYQSDYEKYEETNFANLAYSRPDINRFYSLADSAEKNCSNLLQSLAVNDMFTEMVDIYNDMYAMISLLSVYTALDVTDSYYADEYLFLQNEMISVTDRFTRLAGILKKSRCAGMIEFYNGKDVWDYFGEYEEKDESETAYDELVKQENALLTEYNALSSAEYSVPGHEDLNGFSLVSEDELLSLEELEKLYAKGYVDYEMYLALQREIYAVKNQAYGDVYCRLVAVRNQIAENRGYDSFAEYAYENLYSRQYKPLDIEPFRTYVKEELVPFYNTLLSSLDYDLLAEGDAYIEKIYPDRLQEVILPVLETISPEMKTAFTEMEANSLCSFAYSPVKAEMSFTTYLQCYNLPFLFIQPSEKASVYDFFTVVHEFGHYYSYLTNSITEYNANDLDASEVASQAFELIFSEYMGEIFKENGVAAEAYRYILVTILNAVISGCLYDEFQQRVYSLETCTTEEINRLYAEARTEYGSEFYDAGDGMSLSWIDVAHNFIAPFYYISYASSAVASLQIWSSAEAEKLYFTFTENGASMFFMDNIEACGLADPFAPDTMRGITETVRARCGAFS